MTIDSLFEGIGTEIVMMIIGMILGVVGDRVFLKINNKQAQRAGKNSMQSQVFGENISNLDIVGRDKVLSTDKYVFGDYYDIETLDEFDIRNYDNYDDNKIAEIIDKGNNATRRIWCLKLITTERSNILINRCLELMNNEREKTRLIEGILLEGYVNSPWITTIAQSLKSDVARYSAIRLLGDYPQFAHQVSTIFSKITNNVYLYKSLVSVYDKDKNLYKSLYNEGKCFTNKTYKKKLKALIRSKKEDEKSKRVARKN